MGVLNNGRQLREARDGLLICDFWAKHGGCVRVKRTSASVEVRSEEPKSVMGYTSVLLLSSYHHMTGNWDSRERMASLIAVRGVRRGGHVCHRWAV